MNTNFSRHAYERVLERLSMDLGEVADLLDWDLAVKIGEEKGTHRIHRLFYSHEDRQCFIAIQDETTKTVVTILPGDYYETLAAKIPLPSLVEAERLVSCPPAAKPKKAAPPPPSSRGPAHTPPQFRVICTFTTLHGKPRFASLGQWPPEQYGGSIARLIQDARFFEVVRTRLNENIRPGEYAAGLLISLGKMGEPVWVKIDDEELEQLPELSFLAGN